MAASIITVIQLTSEVIPLLCKYIDGVKGAEDDIVRLNSQLHCIAQISESAQELLREENNENLKTSHKLHVAFRQVQAQLKVLKGELNKGGIRVATSRVGFRALIWSSKVGKIEKATQDLERCIQAITAALQVDQTYVNSQGNGLVAIVAHLTN